MKRTFTKRFASITAATFLMAMFIIQIPATISMNQDTMQSAATNENISTSANGAEGLQLVVAMGNSFDIDEPITLMAAAIRDARATYVKPVSITCSIYVITGGIESVISTRTASYNEIDQWVKQASSPIDRLNDYIYYTTFQAYGYDADLVMRVSMSWVAPWGEIITSTKDTGFAVGHVYNISASMTEQQQAIKSTLVDGIDLGIDNLAIPMIRDIDQCIGAIRVIVDKVQRMVGSSQIDPGNLNFYIVDLVGTAANPGPMYTLVKNDLYSGLANDAARTTAMAARHSAIMTAMEDSLQVLDDKLGADHDASPDGDYTYTVTFVRRLYEYYTYGANGSLVNPADSVDSSVAIAAGGYSDSTGNVTGGSWNDAYNGGSIGSHDVSLEFLLEPATGAHPKFKSPDGTYKNTKPCRKSIVINTMGPYWPILNSWFDYYERPGYNDRPSTVIRDASTLPSNPYDFGYRQLIDDSNVMANIRRLVLKNGTTLDGGTSPVAGDFNDMFDTIPGSAYYMGYSNTPIVNYSSYIKKLGQGMSDSFYFWINMGGGRPFSRMTRDINYDVGPADYFSDASHEVIFEMGSAMETDYYHTHKWTGATMVYNIADFKIDHYYNKTMFQILDSLATITNDQSLFEIESKRIGTMNTEYYKIDPGRWVDAFFNGTDLSQYHGTLGSANYITAREETANGWWSPKSMMHSFAFEDTGSFNRLGLLTRYSVPNEYAWTIFVGPDKQVPIGWMTSSSMWYSVVGTYDMQMALEYLYGGIFMGYKETVLGFKSIAIATVTAALEGTGITTPQLQYLLDQSNALDQAWADLDLHAIDVIGNNIMKAINQDNGDGSMISSILEKVQNRTVVAYSFLKKDESSYEYIDGGLSASGSDLSLQSVGEIIQRLMDTSIIPAMEACESIITSAFASINAFKQDVFNTSATWANNIMEQIKGGFDQLLTFVGGVANVTADGFRYVGDLIVDVTESVNESITQTTNNIVTWTTDQVNAAVDWTQSQITNIASFIDENVFNSIRQVVDNINDGITSVLAGAQAISDFVFNAAEDAVNFGIYGTPLPVEFLGSILGAAGIDIPSSFGGGAWGGWENPISHLLLDPAAEDLSYARTLIENPLGAASGIVSDMYDGVTGFLTGGQNLTSNIFNGISSSFNAVADHSLVFINSVGDAITGLSSFTADLGVGFGELTSGLGDNIARGFDQALSIASGLVNDSMYWTRNAFQRVMDQQLATANAVLATTQGSIAGALNLVDLVIVIVKQVTEIISNLVDKINDAFRQVTDLFSNIADFLIDLVATPVSIAVDYALDVTESLAATEEQVAKALGFYPVMSTLHDLILDAKESAALLLYAEETMGSSTETFYGWVDVVQPVALAQGGDSGFRIFQMGTTFTDNLYFVTTYNGDPVQTDDIVVTASRPSMEDEIAVNDFLEATIPVYNVYDDNETRVDGLYYCSFNTTVAYDWYDAAGFLKHEAARSGDYLTRVDANYTTPISSPHEGAMVNNTWMERTTLFEPGFTQDAFPVITILTSYPSPVAAGTTTSVQLSVLNEMYSQPDITIRLSISTSTGFVIASRDVVGIGLVAEDSIALDLDWQPLADTPSGTYQLLVSVIEPNGDVTTSSVNVTIEATTVLGEILGWILGLFGGIFGFAGITLYARTKRPGMLSGKKAIARQFSCSISDIETGTCAGGKVALKCDPKTKECKFVF